MGDGSRFLSSDDDVTREITRDMPRPSANTEPQSDGASAPTMPFSAELAPGQNSEPAPQTIGRYRVCGKLGEGTFGAVYRCRDEELHRDVAIKLAHAGASPSPERLAAFRHEAQSAARVEHPGIVAVLDIGQSADGRGFIVYQYIAGETLRDRIARRDYGIPDAVAWVIQLAETLHCAHRQGIVHRDIKPANVLLDAAGQAHLTDFGLAKLDDHYFVDDTGRVLGTVAYMSPEQARGHSHWATPQSDVYSLGVLLYQLLTGQLPFHAESTIDLLEQVEHRDPPPPRAIDETIPRPLEDVCLAALAKSASARFSTAADMADALRATQIAPSGSRVQPLVLACLGLAGLALVAALMWLSSGQLPGASPLAAAAGTPRAAVLEIYLQREWEHSGEHKPVALDDMPLRSADRVQFHAVLPAEAYPYLYWYDAAGEPQRIWPEPGPLPARQRALSEIWSPLEAQQGETATWWPLTGPTGIEVALLLISDKPLSADELAEFESHRLELSGALARSGALVEIAAEPRTGQTRSLGEKVVSAKTALAPQFARELTERFRSYHGWALQHE